MDDQLLPDGVKLIPIQQHHDERGIFTEIYRQEWEAGFRFPQWNVVHSKKNVLRGVHVHPAHADYLIILSGSMQLLLHDIRPESSTHKKSTLIQLDHDNCASVVIPPGVAHGFYFPEDTIHFYAVSQYWNIEEEIGCMWDCPELNIDWKIDHPILSDKDAHACSYQEMLDRFLALRSDPAFSETAA